MELQLEKLKVSMPDEETESSESARRFAEKVVIEAIRSGQMTAAQGRRILGLSRYDMDGFLKKHEIYLDYSIEDLERDIASSREISKKRLGDTR